MGGSLDLNSVNVVLARFPWDSLPACTRSSQNVEYEVSGGSLGFSLIVFFCTAIVAIALLLFRRGQGGELGGATQGKWISFRVLIGLWVIFLILSGLYDYGQIPHTDAI
eukprot:gene12748-15997_t